MMVINKDTLWKKLNATIIKKFLREMLKKYWDVYFLLRGEIGFQLTC